MPLRSRHVRAAAGATALALAATNAHAQRVATRADLGAFLGGSAVTEDFEDMQFTGYVTAFGQITRLDATTSRPGLPAGVIVPGLAFTNGNNAHYFHQPTASTAHLGYTSKTYAPGRNLWDLLIDPGSRAIGFDLFTSTSLSATAGTVTFYGDGDVALGSITETIRGGQSRFFGWQSAGADIRRVHISGFYPSGASSADIDDITFGAGPAPVTTTPEPATTALLAGGLAALAGVARRRRSA